MQIKVLDQIGYKNRFNGSPGSDYLIESALLIGAGLCYGISENTHTGYNSYRCYWLSRFERLQIGSRPGRDEGGHQ